MKRALGNRPLDVTLSFRNTPKQISLTEICVNADGMTRNSRFQSLIRMAGTGGYSSLGPQFADSVQSF